MKTKMNKTSQAKKEICGKCGHVIIVNPNKSWYHLNYKKHPSRDLIEDRGLKKGECDCDLK